MASSAAVLALALMAAIPDAAAQQGSLGIFPMPPPLPGQGRPGQPAPQQPPPQSFQQPQQPPARQQPAPQPSRQAAPQGFPVTVHGAQVQLPVAAGHCGLDETQAFDKSIADAIRGNVGSDNLLLAITMDCDGIVASRAGQAVGVYAYSFQTLTQAPQQDLAGIDRAAAAQRVCQQAMAQGNETPTRGRTGAEKAAEIDAAARAAGGNGQALAVLQTRGPACYIGHVRVSANAGGGTTAVSEVAVITIVQARVVIMSLNSVNADALPQMLPRAEALVQQLFSVNGVR